MPLESLKEHEGDSEKRKLEAEENGPHNPKKPRWKNRGMNKNRGPTFRVTRDNEFCPRLVDRQTQSDPNCTVEGCSFIHDVDKYLGVREPVLGEECYVFKTSGHCPRGITCRYGSKHVTKEGLNIINESLNEAWKNNRNLHTTNSLKNEVQFQLRKRTYNFSQATEVLTKWNLENEKRRGEAKNNDNNVKDKDLSSESATSNDIIGDDETKSEIVIEEENVTESEVNINGKSERNRLGPILDFDFVKLRREEKKKIDWSGKLFLSPLTTVGNLPFRRICKEYGADVTCGEMAMAANLLQGKPQEWALTKRHGSEDLFGVQICGGKPEIMTRCAQLIKDQTDVDYVDINVGCPIDLVCRQGAGSGLLTKKRMLFSIVNCMSSVLDVPLTVKTRTGVYSGKNVVHNYMQDLVRAGADLITVHGRTKEQRYTKQADWDYVEQCAQLASPIPVVGNGDILSYEDYDFAREKSPTAASVMIGRGALIKPWIFTEIKERRHWDISSAERLDMLRRYTNYGLEHWGSDTKGVENTRRFLLEWLSFLYRYVPVGILPELPQRMNERPPKVTPRNDLEELMMSANCNDWIKISEMLLGPVPSGFSFVPKHKANSWT